MNKQKVFAKSITNLTDARYFAAMGVDYLGFELSDENNDFVDIEFLKRVREWIEGPSVIGCVKGNESVNHLTKLMVDGELDGLYFEGVPNDEILRAFESKKLFIELLPDQLSNIDTSSYKIVLNNVMALKAMADKPDLYEGLVKMDRLFLTGDFNPDFFNSSLFKLKPGLVLMGSEEEKLGFKSFEDLDEIFERLGMI
jgi:phosphoribosylanthranilate isomerase